MNSFLNIFYNSQAVNGRPGVLGAGWFLTQNYIYRDINSTPNSTLNDEFILVLDGTPYELIYTSNGIWHTEVEYYFKIENLSTDSDTYWVLTKKNGVK